MFYEDLSDLYIPYEAAINIWNNLFFGNLRDVEVFIGHCYHLLQSKTFWKEFDGVVLLIYEDISTDGSEKLTRLLTRGLLKYLGDKIASNQTQLTNIADVWETVNKDMIDLNIWPENIFRPLLEGQKSRLLTR